MRYVADLRLWVSNWRVSITLISETVTSHDARMLWQTVTTLCRVT